jgi:hypothetical protein
VPGWLAFLDGKTHHSARSAAYAIWAIVPLLGIAAGALTFSWNKDGALRASAWLAATADAISLRTAGAVDRFILEPSARIADRTADALSASDTAIGRVSLASGMVASAAARAPALPVLVVMTVLVALLVGLLSPGVLR